MVDLFSLWDLAQNRRIGEARAKADSASSDAVDAKVKARDTEFLVDRLILVSRAMWELLSLKLGISESQLIEKVSEIDLRDGRQDGKIQGKSRACGSCGRVLNARHFKCIYCGSQVLEGSAFDPLSG